MYYHISFGKISFQNLFYFLMRKYLPSLLWTPLFILLLYCFIVSHLHCTFKGFIYLKLHAAHVDWGKSSAYRFNPPNTRNNCSWARLNPRTWNLFRSLQWVSSIAFPGVLAGNWVGSRGAKNQTSDPSTMA